MRVPCLRKPVPFRSPEKSGSGPFSAPFWASKSSENRSKTDSKTLVETSFVCRWIFERFLMDFRGPGPSKNVQKCSTVSKFWGFRPNSPYQTPDSKNFDFGLHFGGKNASKIEQNGDPKMDPNLIASWKRFLSILGGFWDPRPSPKSPKNRDFFTV